MRTAEQESLWVIRVEGQRHPYLETVITLNKEKRWGPGSVGGLRRGEARRSLDRAQLEQ